MKIYFEKSFHPSSANLKIVNAAGEVLSFAADDSCGVFPVCCRTYMQRFENDELHRTLGEEQYNVTPVSFIEALAAHLGYTVTKK